MRMSSVSPPQPGVIPEYRARIAAGTIVSDPAQASAAERLQALWAKLRGYDPTPKAPPNGWMGRLLRRKPVEEVQDRPHGLYLVGDVGRGKTAAERRDEVATAFAVRSRRVGQLEGRRVLLIDDVMTSGATAGACSESLLAAVSPYVALSTGSACTSASGEASYVLRALGRDTPMIHTAARRTPALGPWLDWLERELCAWRPVARPRSMIAAAAGA